jgi:pimeloyl-ACP methyl ester carboxylesterase
MNPFRIGMILFFICNIASTSTSYGAGRLAQSMSNFPEMEGRTKELIKKIYDRLIPLESKGTTDQLYPGGLYDVGGYRLHLFCMGESKKGTPTVLFESGAGGSSADWIPIQVKLSKRAKICAYDRAGYGWSDSLSALNNISSLQEVLPRPIDKHVEALDILLKKAQISGPILLVGHSYGGPIALAFEAKFPDLIKGLVLLDPHDDGIARKDSAYSSEISDSLKNLEKEKAPENKEKWSFKLREISEHIDRYSGGPKQEQLLTEDLWTLINSLDPMKWQFALWGDWRAFRSSCAKVKTHPSQTLLDKALTVVSSDPTHERSEGQSYLHMKIAKQSTQGKFYIAMGSSHNIAGDRPDLILKVINDMLDSFENKSSRRSSGPILPQLKVATRFFVDGELAEYVRTHSEKNGKLERLEKLEKFCRQLGFGFKTAQNSGFYENPQTGIMGYYVTCK